MSRTDPDAKMVIKDNISVVDLGDRAKHYVFDLNTQTSNNVAVLDSKEGTDAFREILKLDGGPRHLNNDLGLKTGSGEDATISVELAALIQAALNEDESDGITLVDGGIGDTEITIAVTGDWSTDHFTFKGDLIKEFLEPTAIPSDIPTGLDLKNSASQEALFDFDAQNSIFSGNDADVDSAAARAIIGGSRLDKSEITDLVQLALDGDPNVNVDVRADAVELSIDASRDTVDTVIITNADLVDLLVG